MTPIVSYARISQKSQNLSILEVLKFIFRAPKDSVPGVLAEVVRTLARYAAEKPTRLAEPDLEILLAVSVVLQSEKRGKKGPPA